MMRDEAPFAAALFIAQKLIGLKANPANAASEESRAEDGISP